MLGKLRRFLGDSFLQGLANEQGRKVDINELTISREHACWGSSGVSLVSPSPGSSLCEGKEGGYKSAYHQSCTCVLWQLRHLLGESIHQSLAYAEGRKVGLGHKAIVLLFLLVPHGDCPACGEVKSPGLVFYLGVGRRVNTALIKKKIIKRKFRRDRLQRLTASTYVVKYLRISSYIRKPFLIYDSATGPT